MPEAATEFGKIKDHVHSIAHGMEQTHSASKQTADALGNILKTLIVADVTLKAIEKASAFSPMARGFMEAFTTLGKTRDQLQAVHYAELDAAQKRFKAGEITEAQLIRIEEITKSRLPLIHAQLGLEREMNRVGGIRLLILTSVVGLLSRMFYLNHEFNEDLIKANSHWKTRAQLFYENLQVQQETGVAFRSVTEAQKELINYGFQTRRNYHDVLTTVVKLREGLGMSVHEATQLAVVTERQVKVAFKDTADIVAGLVDSTSLAADEVGRLATNLGRAMAVIKPGGVREFPQIVKLVGQYEDALKKFGGQVGQFEQLISRMTRPDGLLSAGALGIGDPEKLLKTAGVDQAIDRFYKYATSQLAGAKGFDRMFRLDILAEQFGTTAEQINAMIQAIEEAKKARSGEITLQERFRQQMQSTGEGLKRIANSLAALAQGALYPVIVGVNWLTNFVANLLQTILRYRPLAIAAMVAVGVSVVAAIIKLKSAALAFWEVVVAAQAAAISLKRYAVAQGASTVTGSATGVAGGATAGGGLAALGSRIVSALSALRFALLLPLKAIAAVLGVSVGIAGAILAGVVATVGLMVWTKRIQTKMMEDQMAANAKLSSMRDTYLDTAKTQIYMATRGGDPTKVQEVMDRVMKQIGERKGSFSDLTEREAAIKQAQFSKDLQKLVPLAQYTATQFGNLRVTPEERDAKAKENSNLQQKIADNTKKSIDEARRLRDDENKRADEEKRQKELRYMRNGGITGRGNSIYSAGPL